MQGRCLTGGRGTLFAGVKQTISPSPAVRELEDGIAFVALNSFGNDKVVTAFEGRLPDLRTCRGFVLDLRRNGGGSSTVAMPILRRLLDRPVPGEGWKTREHRATLVGQKTVGSTGQSLTFPLPGGGSARVCTIKPTYPDGREFVGYGVSPDVLVEPTVEDFLSGRDVVLEVGIEVLRKKLSG